MPSRRRSSKKNLSNNLAEVNRRIRTLERRPVRTLLKNRVVTGNSIAPLTITPTEVAFGTVTVVPPDSTVAEVIATTSSPIEGNIIVDATTGETQVYVSSTDTYTPIADLTATAIADGKNTIFTQGTAPTATKINDIWIDTSDGNKLYTWNGTIWESVQDAAIAAADAAATAAQTTADGKSKIYRQATEPTGGSYNNSDLWFDTDDGNKMYKYTSPALSLTVSNKSLTSNVATLTTTTTHGLNIRENVTVVGVDSTFNGTWVVTAVPSTTTFSYVVTHADVTSTSSSGTVSAGPWRAVPFGTNALGEIDASVVNVSNINAGNISAGYIAAARIQANSLDVSVLQAGTLRAGTIYTGDISASQLTAGTITATIELASVGGVISATATDSHNKIIIDPGYTSAPIYGVGQAPGSSITAPIIYWEVLDVSSPYQNWKGIITTVGRYDGAHYEIASSFGFQDATGSLGSGFQVDQNTISNLSTINLYADQMNVLVDSTLHFGTFTSLGLVTASAGLHVTGSVTVSSSLQAGYVDSSPSGTGVGLRGITIDTAAPSGGSDGDVWLVYV